MWSYVVQSYFHSFPNDIGCNILKKKRKVIIYLFEIRHVKKIKGFNTCDASSEVIGAQNKNGNILWTFNREKEHLNEKRLIHILILNVLNI